MGSDILRSVASPFWSLTLMRGPSDGINFSPAALDQLSKRFFQNPSHEAANFFRHFSTVSQPETIACFRQAFEPEEKPAFLLSLITQPVIELVSLEIILSDYIKPSPELKSSLLTSPPVCERSLLLLDRLVKSPPTAEDVRFGITPKDRESAKISLQVLPVTLRQKRTRSGSFLAFKPSQNQKPNTGSHPVWRSSTSTGNVINEAEIVRLITQIQKNDDLPRLLLKLRKLAEGGGTLGEMVIKEILTRIHNHLEVSITDLRYRLVREELYQINPKATISAWEELTKQPWDLSIPQKK